MTAKHQRLAALIDEMVKREIEALPHRWLADLVEISGEAAALVRELGLGVGPDRSGVPLEVAPLGEDKDHPTEFRVSMADPAGQRTASAVEAVKVVDAFEAVHGMSLPVPTVEFPRCVEPDLRAFFHAAIQRWKRKIVAALDTVQTRTSGESGSPPSSMDVPIASAGKSDHPQSRKAKQVQWIAKAMLTVRDHPDWSDAEVARSVGKDKSTLARSQEYRRAAAVARSRNQFIGKIDIDPVTKQRTVEAQGGGTDHCAPMSRADQDTEDADDRIDREISQATPQRNATRNGRAQKRR